MDTKDSAKKTFRYFLKQKRVEAGLTIAEMHELSVKYSKEGKCLPFSAAYYCQVEKGIKEFGKINFDLIWATGIILGFDPVDFYVQTRVIIENKYLNESERKNLFNNPVNNKKNFPAGYVVVISKNPKLYWDFRGMPVKESRRAKQYKGSKAGQNFAKKALARAISADWPGAYIEEMPLPFETP